MLVKPMPQWLIFDFDGTLADTFGIVIEALNHYASDYRYQPLDDEAIANLRGLSAKQILRRLNIRWYQQVGLVLKLRQYLAQHCQRICLFPGLAEQLHLLKQQGVSLGIVSSNSVENIQAVLHRYHADCFDFIDESRSLFGKARVLKQVLKHHQIDPKQACLCR